MLRGDLRSVLIFLLLIVGYQGFSQINDPFSRYGIGTLRDYDFTLNQSMGSMSSAFSDPRYINTVNPASYADFYSEQYSRYLKVRNFDSTVIDPNTGETLTKTFSDSIYRDTLAGRVKNTSFQTAIDLSFYNTLAEDGNERSSSGSIGYFALGFPIPKVGGISVGILPYSSVNYNLQTTEQRDSIGQVDYNYRGNGGLYQFYTGGAVQYKNLKAGFNVRYIFGSINLDNTLIFTEQSNAVGTRASTQVSVNGVTLDAGLQYNLKLSEDLDLQVGGFGKIPSRITATADTILESIFFNAAGGTANLDTVFQNTGTITEFTIPSGYGVGFMFESPGSWLFGMDYKTDRWQGEKGFLSNTDLNTSWKLSAGGQIIPNQQGNFLEKVNYRLGAYYSKTNMRVNSNDVLDYGMTFGFGIPIVRPREPNYSTIDLSIQLGKVGNIRDNIIAENYVKVSLGFNLNDNSWIFKSKFY